MTLRQCKLALRAVAALTLAAVFVTLVTTSSRVRAGSTDSDSRIQIGYDIAPVKLNLKGLNPALVGIGSYIVNAQADCNGCHTSPDYGPEYLNDPTFVGVKAPGTVNPAAYLGGGVNFGTFPGGATIFTRNLTPDVTGKAEGGHSLEEFMNIMRTGHDYDNAHPPCPQMGAEGCIQGPPATPLNGNVLQIMPWPTFSHMSDNDLQAIYEYLSAIPCISHKNTGAVLPSILYQTCPSNQ